MVKQTDYVIINNRAYDPITGLPMEDIVTTEHRSVIFPTEEEVKRRGLEMPAVHQSLQKSRTLNRRYVKHPETKLDTKTEKIEVTNYSPINSELFKAKQSTSISKFATSVPKKVTENAFRPAESHPVIQRANGQNLDFSAPRRQRQAKVNKLDAQNRQNNQPDSSKSLKSAKTLKNEAILDAMNREINSEKKSRRTKNHSKNRFARFMGMAVPSLAVLMMAGYFTYLNMPNLSIRMAAVQSGIDAKYPGYRPSGYALRGPVTFNNDEVSMNFAYADGGHNFTLTQAKSGWNSAALKNSFSDDPANISTTTVDGLTIYSEGNRASWVNGGILYTIDGEADLSNSQIERIATSL